MTRNKLIKIRFLFDSLLILVIKKLDRAIQQINRGYYMATRKYEISVRGLKEYFPSEQTGQMFFYKRREISHLEATM